MAASKERLVKQWIQYLKNNQIVGLKSDPNTGDLTYKREVTADDVTQFLENNTEYSEEQINNAIKMVMAKGAVGSQPAKLQNNPSQKEPGRELSTWQQNDMRPGDPRQPADVPRLPSAARREMPHKKSNYSKDDAEDIEYTEIREAVKDTPSQSLSEKDVESVFSILSSSEPNTMADKGKQKGAGAETNAARKVAEPEDPAKKQEDIKKMMRIIRDIMTPPQRKMFWRALQSGKEDVTESQINSPDVKAVLKGVSTLRTNPSVLRKIPGLKKDKISVSDLQKAWAEGDTARGIPQYSDDTRDIKYILSQKFGYSKGEIDKVFSQVFGSDKAGKPNEPTQSPAIQKFADYAKKNGIDNELIAFMQREFGKELGLEQPGMMKKFGDMFKKKAVAEEVRDIFTAIVNEERSDQPILVRQFQQIHLGRIKK